MGRARDVDAGIGDEKPEIRSQTRVEIKQLVLAVATVEPPIHIQNASVPDGPAKLHGHREQSFVSHRTCSRRDTTIGGPRSVLATRKGDQWTSGAAAIGMNDPILGGLRRYVLL
jgi:hypothetical protein